MIKSKVDARERALELAVELWKGQTGSDELVVKCAENFKSFLIGNAELLEVQSDTELVKAFLEVANNEIEKSRERNNRDLEELIKTLKERDAGFSDEIPCKSKAE